MTTESSTQAPELEAFKTIALGFMRGIVRQRQARLVAIAAEGFIYRCMTPHGLTPECRSSVGKIGDVSEEEIKAFVYFANISGLVYATALFDTFLSETARFLFLRNPAALGRDAMIPVAAVLSAASRMHVVNDFIDKRVKEMAFGTFAARLRQLRNTFGLTFLISEELRRDLEHLASTRNVIVHDQSLQRIHLNDDMSLQVTPRGDPRHLPTPVSEEEVEQAERVFSAVVLVICADIRAKIFKGLADADLVALEKLMREEVSERR